MSPTPQPTSSLIRKSSTSWLSKTRTNFSSTDSKSSNNSQTSNSSSTWFTTCWGDLPTTKGSFTHKTLSCRTNMTTVSLSHPPDWSSLGLSSGTMGSITQSWPRINQIWPWMFCTRGSKRLTCLGGLAGNRSGGLKSARWCPTPGSSTKTCSNSTRQPSWCRFSNC